jgi:chemotaxis response regulator CheB
MSSPTFLRIPLSESKSMIVPKSCVRRVSEDVGGIVIECRIGNSISYVRPRVDVSMDTIAEALKAQQINLEIS